MGAAQAGLSARLCAVQESLLGPAKAEAEGGEIVTGVEPGNPDNWPRTIAREHPDLGTAIDALLENVDDANLRFAVTEFIRERLAGRPRRKPKEAK